MTRSFKGKSEHQGEITVVEAETCPKGTARFYLAGEKVGHLPIGWQTLPPKWDTIHLAPDSFEDLLAFTLKGTEESVIVFFT